MAEAEENDDGPRALDLDEARRAFKDALHRRRKTWMYDWIIPLFESELEQVNSVIDFRSHMSLHKIRAKLHELQLAMVKVFV